MALRESQEFGRDLSEIDETKLIFALNLIDKFSGNFPIGELEIEFLGSKGKLLKVLKQRATIIKKEKFLLIICKYDFQKNLTIKISSKFYKKKSIKIQGDKFSTDDLDDEQILKNIIGPVNLFPLPNYPFPPTTTLVRGTVLQKENPKIPAKNVEVVLKWFERKNSNLEDKELITYTTERGEFVLFIDLSKLITLYTDDAKVNFTTRLITIKGKEKFDMYIKKVNNEIKNLPEILQIKESFSNSIGTIIVGVDE